MPDLDPRPASVTPPGATVYYNSACPVCDVGIRSQQGRVQGCELKWVDVHAHPEALESLGLDLETVRERLHVREADGRLRVGADALGALWERTPGQRWLAWCTRRARWLSEPIYNAFARVLYRWNRRRGHW